MSRSLFILLESSAPQHNRQTPCQPCSRPASARPSRWFCPCFTRPVRQGELASASCSASRHISWQCRPMPLDRNDYPDRSTCVCRVPFAYPNASNPPTVKCPAARVILQANWHQRWLPTAPRTRASHKACQATPGYPPPRQPGRPTWLQVATLGRAGKAARRRTARGLTRSIAGFFAYVGAEFCD